MILQSGIWIISAILLIISIIILYSRKKHSIIAEYIIWHIAITTIIISIFFPMPYQSEIISNKAYIEKPQTIVPFKVIYEMISFVKVNKNIILWEYIRDYVLVSISIGCTFSVTLRISFKSRKVWFFGCLLFSIGMQVIKYIICLKLRAQYLSVTVEDVLYILMGAILGYCIINIVRYFIKKMECESLFEIAIYNLITKNQ